MANIFSGRITREYYLTSQYVLGLVAMALAFVWVIMVAIALTAFASSLMADSANAQTTEEIEQQIQELYTQQMNETGVGTADANTPPDSMLYTTTDLDAYNPNTATSSTDADRIYDDVNAYLQNTLSDDVSATGTEERNIEEALEKSSEAFSNVFTGIIGITFLFLGVVFGIALFVLQLSLAIRRLHDLGQSGWMALLMIVPVANLVLGVYLSLARGVRGDNVYGPDMQGVEFGVFQALFNQAPTSLSK